MEKLIYFDHAATSWPKPPSVLHAVGGAFTDKGGNPGRSGHVLSLKASRAIYECREAVFKLIKISTEAIHQNGGWIGICGEMAADLSLTQRFVDIGVDELSVAVPYLLGVREKICACK